MVDTLLVLFLFQASISSHGRVQQHLVGLGLSMGWKCAYCMMVSEHGSMVGRSMGGFCMVAIAVRGATAVRFMCNGGLWSGQPQMRAGLVSPTRACQACLGLLHPHTVLRSFQSPHRPSAPQLANHCSAALCGAHAIAGGGVRGSSQCMRLCSYGTHATLVRDSCQVFSLPCTDCVSRVARPWQWLAC